MELKSVPEPTQLNPNRPPVYIDNFNFAQSSKTLLRETMDDLLAAYFSEEYDLGHRTMVYDNYVGVIHSFLAHYKQQEPKSDDKYAEAAEWIAKSEKIAYQTRHYKDKLPAIEEPIFVTGEIKQIIGFTAAKDTVSLNNETSPPFNYDELVAVVS